MTRKEKLYNEWMAINEQIEQVKPEFNAAERAMSSYDIRNYSVADWESKIKYAKQDLENAQKAKKVSDFYATEEGMAYKKTRENRIIAIQLEIGTNFAAFEKSLREYVKSFLGEEFDILLSSTHCEIGLVEKMLESGRPSFYFGHSFDVYFEIDKWYSKKGEFKFKINFGTMGAFDPQKDVTYATYVMALGKFTGSHAGFRGLAEDYAWEFDALKHEQWVLERELKNPEI